jgi:hypothetical protein
MEDLKVEVLDIETLLRCYLVCSYCPSTGEKFQFEISRRKNQLDGLIKHLLDFKRDYIVDYNGLTFDGQVLQYTIDNYESFSDLSAEQIAEKISNFAAECIDRQKYELKQVYNPNYMDFSQIDLLKVWHYDNRARRTSLKWLEFTMDFPDIEEMPIDFRKDYLTDEEIEDTIKYCWNDVMATYEFYKITRGDTQLELYRGKDKIQERLDVMEEFGFGKECLSWSDVKIGDEINKKGYMEETGCSYGDLYKKKKSRKPTPHFTFGDCIPEYVKFQTKEFNNFHNSVKGKTVNLNKTKQTFEFRYGKTNYIIAQGGIHSVDKPRIVTADEKRIKKDADIGSQYPNAINKRCLYPSQLGKPWNTRYEKTTHQRINYKSRGKENRKFKSLAEMYKLCLNGGGFGMTSQKDNWQYDPFVTFACTIGNQFEILMLIEALEMSGISVISANTDGIISDIPRELEDKYYEICHEWERNVGNDKIGMLEYADYKKLVQTSVNDYLAIGVDGKVKLKGDFVTTEIELHKNKSNRISPIAVYEYFVNGTPIEETVRNHRRIYDFCIAKKASKDYFYRQVDRKLGTARDLNKLVRYFCAKSPDTKLDTKLSEEDEVTYLLPGKLYKIKHENSEKTGPKVSQCESSSGCQQLFNRYYEVKNWEDYNIDYQYYINKANEIVDKVDPVFKRDRKLRESGQISMF